MANLTDPLARPIHGTNPQNLIEYITRQRIYDSQYWKETCFGLTAEEVTEKAALQLQGIGGSYGGNSQPTRFLCLTLKLLQIQPEEGIVEELINNEDFKYVRALGAFYTRLTGRPAEIYERLEPLYNDYRKIRFRNPSDWSLIYMDEFIDRLLRDDRVCGIALPRLPNREVLVEAGYLDGPRVSAFHDILGGNKGEDDRVEIDSQTGVMRVHKQLDQMARDGNIAAKEALKLKEIKSHNVEDQIKNVTVGKEYDGNHHRNSYKTKQDDSHSEYPLKSYSRLRTPSRSRSRSRSRSWERHPQGRNEREVHRYSNKYNTKREAHTGDENYRRSKENRRRRESRESRERSDGRSHKSTDGKKSFTNGDRGYTLPSSHRTGDHEEHRYQREDSRSNHKKRSKDKKKKSKYGSLFKSPSTSTSDADKKENEEDGIIIEKNHSIPGAGKSDEYWNDERAKLGLKPLRK